VTLSRALVGQAGVNPVTVPDCRSTFNYLSINVRSLFDQSSRQSTAVGKPERLRRIDNKELFWRFDRLGRRWLPVKRRGCAAWEGGDELPGAPVHCKTPKGRKTKTEDRAERRSLRDKAKAAMNRRTPRGTTTSCGCARTDHYILC
jgi:hypothetical protein